MLYINKAPQGNYSECFRSIRTNIKYSSVDKKDKVILVTSTDKSEGKSTIVSNLGLTLAEDNNRVLIIDCDLRRPTINKVFNISGQVGLTDILINEKAFKNAIYKHSKNIDVLPAGKIPPNPAELVSSEKLQELINRLRDEYDYILIDTTPLGIVADSQILMEKVDGVILVARSEKTKKKKLLECKKIIDMSGGKIIGVILNRVKEKINNYYYA